MRDLPKYIGILNFKTPFNILEHYPIRRKFYEINTKSRDFVFRVQI